MFFLMDSVEVLNALPCPLSPIWRPLAALLCSSLKCPGFLPQAGCLSASSINHQPMREGQEWVVNSQFSYLFVVQSGDVFRTVSQRISGAPSNNLFIDFSLFLHSCIPCFTSHSFTLLPGIISQIIYLHQNLSFIVSFAGNSDEDRHQLYKFVCMCVDTCHLYIFNNWSGRKGDPICMYMHFLG